MIKTQSEKTHEELIKKLKETYTSKINEKKSIKNIGETSEIYYSKIKQTWFSLIEDENKYYYIFGKYNSPNNINPQNNNLIIDFTKTEKYDENCLGIIIHKKIYINKINLLKKYPNINLNNFTSKHLLFFQYTYQNISSINLGDVNNKDFIENLEKLIKEIVNNPLEKSKNLFLNSIKAGKTVEQSLKIAKISQKELDDWLEFGKNKNNIHHEFYEDYFKLVNSGKSKTANDNLMNEYDKIKKDNKNIDFGDEIKQTTNIKMNVFLNEYKKDKNLNNSLKKANIDYYLFNLWIKQGKQTSNKYNKFYKEFNKIRETSKIKKDPKKTSKNNQLMNDFIKLKQEGKTNEEIIKKLEIPEFLVKNWINQGKLGNVKYIEFYKAYQLNNKPKSKKIDNKKEIKVDNKKEINVDSNERKCIICGRTLNKNYKKDICKRCARKRYAVKILGKLLSSIEPEIPFKQDDLKALNLDSLQIQNYIWTLKEFNLITENDSKLMLKKREILDKFAEECESEIIIKDNSISLSKTCETCGKTLEISNFLTSKDNEDGYENDCKDCKKLIKSAIFLKELNKYIKWNQEFTEEDLTPYFKDPFILKGNIWNLQDNDLIKNNLNSDKYVLTDEKTGMDFIEKYYKEKYDTPTVKMDSTKNAKIESHKNTKKDQMQIVLDAISRKRTRKESSIIAEIPLYKITHWFNEGKQGFGDENIDFYNKLKSLEKTTKPYSISENVKQIDSFINTFKECKDIDKTCEKTKINANIIDDWFILGKKDINPFNKFTNEYNKINENIVNNEYDEEYNSILNQAKRKIFLEYIKNGSSTEKACEQASLDIDMLNSWLSEGKNRVEPYYDFLKKYEKIQRELKQQQEDKEIQNEIIEMIKNGSSIEEAAKQYKNGSYEKSILSWYEYGKIGDEKYKKFYKQCKEYKIDFFDLIKQGLSIEIACEKANLDYEYVKNKLINKEDDFYNSYIEAKILNEIGEYPLIKPQKYKDNQSITLLMNRIIKLLSKGKTEKEACEIADFPYDTYKYWINRGKQNMGEVYVDFYNEIKSIKKLKSKIDDELHNNLTETKELTFDSKNYEKYKFLLKPVSEYPGKGNRTGFAWTNKIGNQWIYTKTINKKQLKISDENFFKLYEKVISQKQIWGFIDKEKALKTVKNEENEDPNWNLDEFLEICRNLNPQEFDNSEQKEHIAKDILDPLPDKFEENFQKPSKTGFAWVNKTSNKWTYSRSFNGETVAFRKDNIYDLFNEVIENKLTWGVRNLRLAEKSLNENKVPKPPVENINNTQDIPNLKETIELLPEKYKDILKPIDEKNKFKFWTECVSGFAWVDKQNDNWRYSHFANGKRKYFSAENIFLIYDYANKNNCGWGVRDYDKAISVIKEELNQINSKETSNTTSEKNMLISYLSRDESHINILIKGLISENELFNYISNLKEFEKYITRILTNKINEKIDILIELDLDKNLLSKFEKEMKKLGWK